MEHLGSLLETEEGYGVHHHVGGQFADASSWIEWRERAAGDDSGVHVRTPGPAAPSPLEEADRQGHEIEVDDLATGTPLGPGVHATGAVHGQQAVTGCPVRPPGQWDTCLVETSGPGSR
ncbi:hypothetical protein JD79_02860 [Geodermatophilus normandii]|uniref:Uncharacterized protein n=1 Tax=Geodermatophilus normandii TaxID=1137989 RepID=A0A317QN76_9ACTN|nr:hypothetical protein [Geodermatophilus normandii]PWW23685.1 hypothetical protein JD79_02860 [Geodermatophilus normandii]